MKYLRATILASILTVGFSTTSLAGNIGMRTSGNIGMRTTGNIGMRTAGNIGMRGAGQAIQNNSAAINLGGLRLDSETVFSGAFAGLIRMLLESGALL